MSRIPKREIHIGYVCVNIFSVSYILQFCERRNLFCPLQQKSAFQLEFFRLKSRVSFSIKVKLFLIHNLCLLRDFTSDLILYNRIHLKNSGERSKFQPHFRLYPIKIHLKKCLTAENGPDDLSLHGRTSFTCPAFRRHKSPGLADHSSALSDRSKGLPNSFLFKYLVCKQNFYFER